MNIKSTLFAGVLAASMAVPAFANDAPVATPLPQFTAVDTQMLFAQDAMPMQLAVLSQQEMMETEGAWWPVAGAFLGATHYGFSCVPNCTAAGFGYHAAAGAFAPVRGAQAVIWGFNGAAASGMGSNIGSSRGWW